MKKKRCTHSQNRAAQREIQNPKKNQLLLSIYCSCRTVCQYEREDPVIECMRYYEWFHQKCEKIPRKVLTNKQPISFVKDAAKDLASYIASDLLEHSQVKWSVNFYHLLVKYITKLHPALFPIYTACFFSF